MSANSMPNRRTLLNALMALPAVGCAVGTASAGASSGSEAADSLNALFSNRSSAAILGHAYLLQRPEEADKSKLEALLLSPDTMEFLSARGLRVNSPDRGPGSTRELKKVFQDLRCRDFDQGNLVRINGCLLAVTELRLCALIALS